MLERELYCGVNIMINVVIKTIKNMTQEEIAEHEAQQSEAPAPTPTIEERVASVEETVEAVKTILLGEEK